MSCMASWTVVSKWSDLIGLIRSKSKSISRIRTLTCPLSWRPAGQSQLEDDTPSEFILFPCEYQAVTRLMLEKLHEVSELPTTLKTRHVTIR